MRILLLLLLPAGCYCLLVLCMFCVLSIATLTIEIHIFTARGGCAYGVLSRGARALIRHHPWWSNVILIGQTLAAVAAVAVAAVAVAAVAVACSI